MENPEFFQGGYCNTQLTPEKRLSDSKNGDHFIIEDLLDFPNDDGMVTDVPFEGVMTGNSTDSSTVTAVDTSCNSSFSGRTAETHFAGDNIGGCRTVPDGQFSSELCVPYDDLAELEWLSNLVEESFSSEDLQKLQLIQGMKVPTDEVSGTHQYQLQPETTRNARMLSPEMSVPAKARSKRSRTAPGNWTSRLSVVSPTPLDAKAPPAISVLVGV
ncbi:GATA transcription factor 9 [Forsythia ovata]|uniref:GATA transcription factor 9 n=1 Tax=Forsythia ovata TaxID=205694 RepID=A0ABD1W5G2_9LAMI